MWQPHLGKDPFMAVAVAAQVAGLRAVHQFGVAVAVAMERVQGALLYMVVLVVEMPLEQLQQEEEVLQLPQIPMVLLARLVASSLHLGKEKT